jgi:hypothetical protein
MTFPSLAPSLARIALAIGVLAGPLLIAATPVAAGQPWTCVCNGVKKRYIASTRHCENKFKIPKGQGCTSKQYRSVYAPYCVKNGCTLAR